jgi:flagellar hook assembly protein FlgD
VSSDEPGTVTGTATDTAGATTGSFGITVGTSGGTLTWDGRTSSGSYAKDGAHTIRIVARDRAGNASAAQSRTVDLYGSLGFVAASRTLFFPQDGDGLTRDTSLSFKLKSPATVSWVVTSSAGTPVRTIKTDEALVAGTYAFTWNGRDDAGAYVPRGVYYSSVTATNGTQAATQRVALRADAFAVTISDTTPARGQTVTIRAASAEGLDTTPRVRVYQPGIGAWSVTMRKVDTRVYKVSLKLRSSGTGTVTFKVYADDSNGVRQATSIKLALH